MRMPQVQDVASSLREACALAIGLRLDRGVQFAPFLEPPPLRAHCIEDPLGLVHAPHTFEKPLCLLLPLLLDAPLGPADCPQLIGDRLHIGGREDMILVEVGDEPLFVLLRGLVLPLQSRKFQLRDAAEISLHGKNTAQR
jgi:hypothetical protein